MNDKDRRNKNEPQREGDKKRPMKSGFNLFVTLLFVVFMVMLMLTMFGEDSMSSGEEISPITFRKLLYSYRIAKLEIFGHERLEGRFVKDISQPYDMAVKAEVMDGNTNIGKFLMELGRDGIQGMAPDYLDYVGIKAETGMPSALIDNLDADTLRVNAYHTVTSGSDSGEITELFVQFVDSYGERTNRFAFLPGENGNLMEILDKINEKFPQAEGQQYSMVGEQSLTFNNPNTFWTAIFAPLIPWVLIIGLLWFFIIRQMRMGGGGGNVLSFGRSRATLVNKEDTTVTFQDVAGIEEAKEEVSEIVEFLKNPSKFSRLGGRIPSGVLLVGSPGTGKTLLAKAIAGEADVPFFSICGSDFVEMFVGVGASRVRDLFRQARDSSPCLIFLDEIDAVGRKRGSGLGGGHDEREQTLNAILVEMDGFEKDEGIILLAATNRPDVLDPALLRPGRFDREIVIELPDLRGREGILKVHCRKIKVSEKVDLTIIARGTPGFSGAELAAVVNEAALIATLRDRNAVEMEDFEEARDKVRWGRQKKSRIMDDEDKLITAYHESGHALVAHLLPQAERLHKVTIIPRGAALGATMILPDKDRYHHRRNELLANVKVLYAGRIAEEQFCGDISGGAKNDIDRASDIARAMVCQLGMSSLMGPISYGEKPEHIFLGEELVRHKNHSDKIAQQIDEEVKLILDTCYQETEKLIENHKEQIELITQALMANETLTGAEVGAIMDGTPLSEIEFEHAPKPEEPEPVKPEAAKAKAEGEEAGSDLDPGDLPAAGEPAY